MLGYVVIFSRSSGNVCSGVRAFLSFGKTEGSGGDADPQCVERNSLWRETVDHTVLDIVDRVGDVYLRGFRVDRKAVIDRIVVFSLFIGYKFET